MSRIVAVGLTRPSAFVDFMLALDPKPPGLTIYRSNLEATTADGTVYKGFTEEQQARGVEISEVVMAGGTARLYEFLLTRVRK